MNTAQNITITENRVKQALNTTIKGIVVPTIKETVKEAVENERIRTGVITKFYPYLDKAEVKLDESGSKVLCKILHRYGGDMIDFYTPLAYKKMFDNKMKEPCIIPRARQHVCVLQIHDADSDENLILGYYQNRNIKGFEPAPHGNIKIMSITEPNLYWIQFGRNGLELRLPEKGKMKKGVLPKEMESFEYVDSKEVYTKEEVYTKQEVDELIAAKIAETLSNNTSENENNDTTP